MTWMIASDIHGSARYCRDMLDAFERERAGRLILLGDLLYHGPRNDLPEEYDPKSVIRLLNGYSGRTLAVRGNCEAEVDQMVLTFPVMAEYALLELNGRTVFITHGHVHNRNNLPPLQNGDILLHGHTHFPAYEECHPSDGLPSYVYMNPGSVSIPKEGTWHGYMTLRDSLFIWKDLDGTEKMRFQI
ncbi:MAG: phosphodiesterase [Clostridia bacterium]|nr:phosphodiesterase [Clostridia bacterium]